MSRPRLIVRAARTGAKSYKRSRDLPGAVPGLLSKAESAILPMLVATEAKCEDARRSKSPGYRPSQHVQVLAALLAEAASQAKASGSEAFRLAM